MIKRKLAAACFAVCTGALATGNVALAQDSELKFVSNITAVAEDESSITINVRGIDVVVDITSDTEVEIEGDEIVLTGLSEGDSVEIEAYFAAGGSIVAEEISILDRGQEEFRLKGQVSDVDFAATAPGESTEEVVRIGLMGTDVYVDDDAKIIVRGAGRVGRGRSDESPLDDLNMYLSAGDNVSARGTYDGTALWVHDLKIGGRDDGEIELEGEIQSLQDDGFIITIEDAGDFVILVDDATELDGELVVGASVKVEGMLTENAAILAFEVDSDDDKGKDKDDDEKDEDDDDDENEDESENDSDDDSTDASL